MVTSDYRGPRLDSSHRQNFIMNMLEAANWAIATNRPSYLLLTAEKTNIKKKWLEKAKLF